MNPDVSILIATRNGEKTIYRSLVSLLPSYQYINEVLIVDDGSSDSTLNQINSFISTFPNFFKISLFSNKYSNGLPSCLNFLIQHISTDSKFLMRLDDDDVCHPNRITVQRNFLLNHLSVDICGTNRFLLNPNGSITLNFSYKAGRIEFSDLCRRNYIAHPTVMIRICPFLMKSLVYNTKYPFSQDYDLWLRLSRKGFRFFNLSEPLIYYSIASSSNPYKSLKQSFYSCKIRLMCLFKPINIVALFSLIEGIVSEGTSLFLTLAGLLRKS